MQSLLLCENVLNFPAGEAGMANPSAAATVRNPITANSRPMTITTAQAGANWFSTSEIKG
jgi:hypothetical protein